MPKTFPILLALLVLSFGCATSPSEIAYKSLAATAHTVDAAMKGWADYVALGLANSDSEAKARELYETYQRHAKLAASQAAELKVGYETGDLDAALKVVDVAAAHLAAFIRVNQAKATPKLPTIHKKI